MSLKYGKREIAAITDVLDGDYDTVEDAAKAVLAEAERIFEERAKYVVVGQLLESKEHGKLKPNDPRAVKVALGWYSTEGDARKEGEGLVFSAASGDLIRTWVVPTFHGTAAAFHKERRDAYEKEAASAKEKERERFRESIRKREEEATERRDFYFAKCKCEHERIDHSQDKPNRCVRIGCECAGFKEVK